MSALLEVKDLQTAYGASQILFGIDLQIPAGGFATLLGRNGMGKTTTVRSILGLTPAQSGTVYFLGERIDQLSPDRIARMGMAVVPEGRLIFPTLTVTENLKAFAANRNASTAPWTLERVFDLFESEGLDDRNNEFHGSSSDVAGIIDIPVLPVVGQIETFLLRLDRGSQTDGRAQHEGNDQRSADRQTQGDAHPLELLHPQRAPD